MTPSRPHLATCCLLIACGLSVAVEARSVSGRIVEDTNADGRVEAGEPPLAGVIVSDGERLVRSDADGRFRFDAPAGPVFVVKPATHAVPTGDDGLPAFWSDRADGRWEVALRPVEAPEGEWTMRLFGDPQPKSEVDVDHYRRDIITSEQALPRARLGVSLGDIVHSNLALYPAMVRAAAAMRTPWLHVSGNHDRDHAAGSDEASLATFRRFFGPDTFAWEEPGLAMVVLDNTVHEPGSGVPARYVGGLRDAQFRFLEAYLATLPVDRMLLVAMHIPLFDTNPDPAVDTFRDADRQRLYRLLAGHPRVLLLSSHTHLQQHRWHGAAEGWPGAEPLHEYNVGAACGAFWSGVKDERGIPDTRMADGTPNGFATLTVPPGGGYALRCAARAPARRMAGVWCLRQRLDGGRQYEGRVPRGRWCLAADAPRRAPGPVARGAQCRR